MKLTAGIVGSLFACCVLLGCGNNNLPAEKDKSKAQTKKDDEIQTALAKLSPEDRRLAEAQKVCAVQPTQRLGSMGTPVKLVLDGETVFLCCDHCEDKAKKDAAATVKKAKELRAKGS